MCLIILIWIRCFTWVRSLKSSSKPDEAVLTQRFGRLERDDKLILVVSQRYTVVSNRFCKINRQTINVWSLEVQNTCPNPRSEVHEIVRNPRNPRNALNLEIRSVKFILGCNWIGTGNLSRHTSIKEIFRNYHQFSMVQHLQWYNTSSFEIFVNNLAIKYWFECTILWLAEEKMHMFWSFLQLKLLHLRCSGIFEIESLRTLKSFTKSRVCGICLGIFLTSLKISKVLSLKFL